MEDAKRSGNLPPPNPVALDGSPLEGDGAWVELDSAAFRGNIDFFCAAVAQATPAHRSGDPAVAPQMGIVLKGNAYGHGLREMARLVAEHESVAIIYVFSLAEAREASQELREGQRILILGSHPNPLPLADAHRFEWVLSCTSQLRALKTWSMARRTVSKEKGTGGPLRLHVHFDTGLGREGFGLDEAIASVRDLMASTDFVIRGCMTHFANTEDVTRQDYARQQTARFFQCAEALTTCLVGLGHGAPERHLSATAAALVLPEAAADAVRIGIGAYGLWPSSETRLSYLMAGPQQGRSSDQARPQALPEERPALRPVLRWRVRSQCVKRLEAGAYVGYGCTYRCDAATMTAVFPVGYADGYARSMTGHAYVLVRGLRCPVIGRIMMNHIIVALPERLGAQPGDSIVATLLGTDGLEAVTAEDLASWSGTINYESVTRISPLLRRFIVESRASEESHDSHVGI